MRNRSKAFLRKKPLKCSLTLTRNHSRFPWILLPIRQSGQVNCYWILLLNICKLLQNECHTASLLQFLKILKAIIQWELIGVESLIREIIFEGLLLQDFDNFFIKNLWFQSVAQHWDVLFAKKARNYLNN